MDPLFVQVADIMLTAMTVELKEEMDSTAEETAVFLKLSVTSMAQEFALEDVDLEAMEPHDAIALGYRDMSPEYLLCIITIVLTLVVTSIAWT